MSSSLFEIRYLSRAPITSDQQFIFLVCSLDGGGSCGEKNTMTTRESPDSKIGSAVRENPARKTFLLSIHNGERCTYLLRIVSRCHTIHLLYQVLWNLFLNTQPNSIPQRGQIVKAKSPGTTFKRLLEFM